MVDGEDDGEDDEDEGRRRSKREDEGHVCGHGCQFRLMFSACCRLFSQIFPGLCLDEGGLYKRVESSWNKEIFF